MTTNPTAVTEMKMADITRNVDAALFGIRFCTRQISGCIRYAKRKAIAKGIRTSLK